jgi:SAM-dependent methyltransferase
MTTWHEDDTFWELMASKMFGEERWTAAVTEIDLIEARLDINPGAHILDMGCGPGRHSLELARRGYLVSGVDRTATYLERARRKAREEDLQVEFIQEDMRNFSRPDHYDAALMLFTTFGYFEDLQDNKQVLVNIYQSLKSDAALVIEMMGKEILARIFRERDWWEQDGIIFLEERKIDKNWSWIENRWIRIDNQGMTEYRVSHWLYSAAELVEMLRECGFQSVSIYGDLDWRAYDHAARRLVAVARK